MDQDAIVIRVEGGHAYVETNGAADGCGHCHEAGGCQSGILTQLFGNKSWHYRLANRIDAVQGERVVVRVAEGSMLRAALAVYVLPLLGLLLGAAAGAGWRESVNADAGAALGALAGFLLGLLAGLLLRRAGLGRITEPELVRRSASFCVSREACK